MCCCNFAIMPNCVPIETQFDLFAILHSFVCQLHKSQFRMEIFIFPFSQLLTTKKKSPDYIVSDVCI